jgi:AcrR family transcriptional regulator
MTMTTKPNAAKRGRPKGSQADVTIIRSAASTFARLGYHQCRIEDILKDCQVSRTNFYRFFKNKESVFRQLAIREFNYFQRVMTGLMERLEEEDETNDHLERLIDKNVELALEAGPFLSLLMTESSIPPEFHGLIKEQNDFSCSLLSNTLKRMGYKAPDPLLINAILKASNYIFAELAKRNDSRNVKHQYCMQLFMQLLVPLQVKA